MRLFLLSLCVAAAYGDGHYTCHCQGSETSTTGTCTEGCPYGTAGDLSMNFRGECPWSPSSDLGTGWTYTTGEHKLDVETVTMFAWVNPHTCDISSDRAIILNKESVYEMGLEKGTCALQAAFSPCWRWWGTVIIPTDVWTHVAVVYDGTNQIHYVNGVQVENTTCGSPDGTLTNNDEDFKIGARGGDTSTGSQFDGDVDDVWLFDTGLNNEEIWQWYRTFSDYAKTSGLVGHWRLDGNAEDSSGHGHHGVAVSPDWVTGKVNQAFHLNGADEVDVEDTGSNPLDVNTLTVMAWVNPHTYTISSDRAIIINKESTYEMGIQAGVGAFQSALSPCWRWWGTEVVPLNTWTHVTLVYDGLNEIHYFNGVEVERTTCGSGGPLANNDQDFKIGARGGDSGTGSSAFDGDIDEVMLFDRYLDSLEVLQHYEDSVGMARIEGLVGHWPLDGDGNDTSGFNHHGETVNAVWVSGRIGQAFQFNGDDEVDIHETGDSLLDVSSLTAFAYINPHSLNGINGDRGIIFNKENTWEMGIQATTGALQSALSGCWFWWGSHIMDMNVWSWVAITYDSATGAQVHYVNGIEVDRTVCSAGDLVNNDQDLKIGARGGDSGTGSQFNGDIDDFWLFRRAMSADEIMQWYDTLTNVARTTGIVAHYPLDGDGDDTSANDLDGVVENADWVTGKIGQAFHFQTDGAVTVADDGSHALDVETLTVMAWINPHGLSFNSDRAIIINKENTYEIGIQKNTGKLQSALSPCWVWWGETEIPLNQWTHIALVYDGTNQMHYVNGVLKQTGACGSGGFLTNNDEDFKIGARGGDGVSSSNFDGDIDDVWILDHYLDSNGVQQWYWDAIGMASDENVVGHWPLDGNGDDVSGNGIDGVVDNADWVDGKIDDAFHFNGDDSVTISDNRGVRSDDYRWSCSLSTDCVVNGSPSSSAQEKHLATMSTPKFSMGKKHMKK